MLGPVIGQVIYSQLGFEFTFYCFALLEFLTLIMAMFIIPSKFNSSASVSEMHRHEPDDMLIDHDIPISYWLFFKNKRAMVASLTAIVSMVIMLFFESILSDELN